MFAVTACGGGGAGAGSYTASIATPVVQGTSPALPTTASQRQASQTALAAVQAQGMFVTYAPNNSSSSLSIGHSISAMMERRANGRDIATVSGCVNGFTEVVTSPSPGVGNVVDTYYYDAACTTRREVVTASINLNTGSGNGSDTLYSQQGTIVLYGALGFAIAKTASTVTFAVIATLSTNPTSSPFASVAVACNAVPLAGGSASCNAADTDTVGGTMIGATIGLSGSVTYAPSGSTLSLSDNAALFAGSIGSLSIVPGSGSGSGSGAWAIQGGAVTDQAAGTGSATYNLAGNLTQASLTVTDTVTLESVSVSGSATGITGVVSFDGHTIASFSTDLIGNGTITYAGGTTGTIQGFSITS